MQAQKDDKVIYPVFKILKENVNLKRAEGKSLCKESKIRLKQSKKLFFENNVLFRRTKTVKQVVLPEMYHSLVYSELHEKLANLSSDRVMELARKRFYWPKMQRDIEFFIKKRCRYIILK